MDYKKIKKLDHASQKLFRNAHPYSEEITKFFPKYKPPEGIEYSRMMETHQTVDEWYRAFRIHTFSFFKKRDKNKLLIQPIGPFPSANGAIDVFNDLFQTVAKYIRTFFVGFEVEIMNAIDHQDLKIKNRVNSITKQTQLFLPDVMNWLVSIRPKNVFCILGISWFDFYPSDEENHILGEGSFQNGVAACSFGHFSLYKERENIQKEFWKQDYVVEPSIEIQGCEAVDGTQEKDSTYIYITQKEKQEAAMNLPDVDSPCKSLDMSRVSPTTSRIKNRFTLIRSIPKALVNSIFASECESNASVDLNMGAMNDENLHDDDVFHDFEVIDFETEQNYLSTKNKKEISYLKSSIPIDCKFNLNCKVFRRILRGATHEICHVIGFCHCSYFSCLMNASQSVIEVDRQPLILCPICLRKLQRFLEFNLEERYSGLCEFIKEHWNYCSHMNSNCSSNMASISLAEDMTCKFRADQVNIQGIIEFVKR